MSITVALDTSTALTCVGVLPVDGPGVETFDVPSPGERPRHATVALSLLSQLLEEQNRSWGDITKFVVGIGPGSFTGIRVGIATALGVAEGVGAELVGVSGLTALLGGLEHGEQGSAMVDARRGELYVAHSNDPLNPSCLPVDLNPASLGGPSTCLGDGALLVRERLLELGFEVPESDSPLHRISPLKMIEAERLGHGSSSLEPLYVREADAIPTSERGAS